jgi:hypothetical protein
MGTMQILGLNSSRFTRRAGIGDRQSGVEGKRFGVGRCQQAQGGNRHKGLHGGGGFDFLLTWHDMDVLCDKALLKY